ncbi:MAG: efflux RND transporter periplasmic adaptor subunit [Acidobacteria bacterium]|nr:efflux RND transporter periplasmic adaptor subunit [Acidobacteriota bacterium]
MAKIDWKTLRSKLWAKKARPYTVAAALFLAFLVWQIVSRLPGGGPQGGPRGAAVAVEIAAVERGAIRDIGTFSGTLIPKSYFTIVPKISGRVKELYVDIGDRLSRGRLVALLEDEEYQQQVIQAEADLGVAQANLEEAASAQELAQKEYDRAKALHAKGILSDASQSALETAKVRLSYTRIRAEWQSGGDARFVGERFINPGAMISSSTAILSVIELQPITAVIHVTEKDYFRLKNEQPVVLTSGAFPGRDFPGAVARVAPLLKETSREARVEVDVDNADGALKPGMFVNARIEFANKAGVTVVPTSALVNRGALQGVFLADLANKKAVFQHATVGIVEGDRAEIVEPAGLAGHVVTLGHHLLENGTSLILPAGAGEPAAAPAAKAAPGDKR